MAGFAPEAGASKKGTGERIGHGGGSAIASFASPLTACSLAAWGRLRSDLAEGLRMSTARAQKAKHKAKAPRHHNDGKSPSPQKVTQSLVAAVVDQVAAVFTPEK
jgi:hypothetical protein